MNIYSKIEPTQIIHIINRKRDIQDGRADLVEPDEFIQCAALKMYGGQTFKAHKHILKHRDFFDTTLIAQESWVVISGLVQVILYDLDNTVLHTDILEPGDCSITLQGGHNYLCMQPSIVYEFKTGPYMGIINDKVFI